jgi:hypothetical protein
MLINLVIWNKVYILYFCCIFKVQIHLFVSKKVVLFMFVHMNYLDERSMFSLIRSAVAANAKRGTKTGLKVQTTSKG